MENNRDGFFFYRSFYEAIQDVPTDESKLKLYQALAEYAILDKEPELDGWGMAVFKTWRTNVDKMHARRDAAILNGVKGGRPKKAGIKPNINQKEPNNNINKPSENLNKNLDNLKKPNINPNNNININNEIENDVEESFNFLEQVSEQVFISNIISDDPDDGVIGDKMIDKLDQEFQFNIRYNLLINKNPSTNFDEIIETLLIDFNEIFDTINLKKMKLQPFPSYKNYQKLVRSKTEPKVIFYEMVKSLQYLLSNDDPRMSLCII